MPRCCEGCSQSLCSNLLLLVCQMDKWEEKQEAAREKKEAKQKDKQGQLAQKSGKQAPLAAQPVVK